MKDKLTLKQRRWLDLYIKTGNATEATIQSYACKNRNSATALASENLRKLNIGEAMEKYGITDQYLLSKLKEGLDSTRTISAKIIMKGGGNRDATSQTDDFIDVPDFNARHKYLELALKLKGRLTNKIDLTSADKEIRFPTVYIPKEVD